MMDGRLRKPRTMSKIMPHVPLRQRQRDRETERQRDRETERGRRWMASMVGVDGGLGSSTRSPVLVSRVCSKEELFEAVCRQRSNLEMQASAQSTPLTGNPAQKNDEPATQLLKELQDLADSVANMEKDLALQPMAIRAQLLVRMFWNVEKRLSTSQNTLRQGFVEELVADTDNLEQLVLDAVFVSVVFSFLVFVSGRVREDLYKSDQRWTQRTDELGQKVQDLSKSVDELRAEVALLRDTVQLDISEKLKHVRDLAAEARSEMMQGQLRDFHQHFEVGITAKGRARGAGGSSATRW